MSRGRSYDDAVLAEAVAFSCSWRAVPRALGLSGTSAAAIRSVRLRAEHLGLDSGHFTGYRRWSDAQLAAALVEARSWSQVALRLGLAGGSSEIALKGHAKRLGLDCRHLQPAPASRGRVASWPAASVAHLPRAGSLLAAAWFTLRGCDVSWPLEPCRYDLVVTMAGTVQRVQVKTTRVRVGATWKVYLSSTRKSRTTYDPDDIDFFFAIDGDLGFYLIPVVEVGGLHAIHLSSYSAFRLAGLQPVAKNTDGVTGRP